jgi:hypothetical protein
MTIDVVVAHTSILRQEGCHRALQVLGPPEGHHETAGNVKGHPEGQLF